jgi:Archaeal holliday junction resolvase (hjc).
VSYRKGRRLEYGVKELLESQGWFVVRAAGSKPVDLVCIRQGQTS